MSDFSWASLFTAGLACLVQFTSAYTQPVGDQPEGNPIYTPGLHNVVPVGQPYTITWDPTTDGTVTLVLLKGPSNNAVPQYAIAEKVMNVGSYVWVPSDSLAPSDGDTGYGIELIVDSNGQYQYTTQFGISNPNYSSSSSASASSTASSQSGYKQTSWTGTGTAVTTSTVQPSGYAAPTGQWTHPAHNVTTVVVHPTGWKPHNATTGHPTGGYHTAKPTLHKTTSSAVVSSYAPTKPVASAQPTGGAATLATSFVGLVFAAGVAVFAL